MDMPQEKKGGELLAKVGAGVGYYPVAAARRLEDPPEDLRRQIAGEVASEGSTVPDDAPAGADAGDQIPLAQAVMAGGGGGGGNVSVSAVVGIVAASTAVTALAGGAVSPVVALGCFIVLLGGVALAMASVATT